MTRTDLGLRSRRAVLFRLGAATLIPMALFAWSVGCAGPVQGFWPPAPGERTHRIRVSLDRWHSVIDVSPAKKAQIQEWAYAEKGYYLEGDKGSSGTLRAILVPSPGVVQVTESGRPWAERTPDPPARIWTFALTDQGYRRLLAHLEREKASPVPVAIGTSTWHSSRRPYHGFHHCHHWTARALRSAGLPVWPSGALFKWSLEAQLDRAARFHRGPDEPRPPVERVDP